MFTSRIESAIDRRGQRMPAFRVDQWISAQPETPAQRLLLIDFWATWCKPCRASVPHLNEIATRWPDMVLVVGITDEPAQAVLPALRMYGMTLESFKYPIASDPNKTLYSFFGVGGIPHGVVVSADGIVRWQGHPSLLDRSLMEQLVEAQRTANAGAPSKGPGSRR